MPAPELLMQAAKVHIPAVLAEPTNATSQQILKLADQIVIQAKPK
jgi:hypothetical protein